MKTAIFYFSGTGNCLKVARDLAGELGGAEIISIPGAIRAGIDLSAERIGIIFPVYMFGMPLIAVDFIKKLKADKNKYIFAVATLGGKAGNTLGQAAEQLESRGLKLSAGFLIKMPGNYTPLYGAIAREKQERIFEKERLRIKEIAAVVREGGLHRIERDSMLLSWLLSGVIYKWGSPQIPACDKSFWADDKCSSCGICERVCPVKNIKISAGKPSWLHKCEQCFACLQWCPEEAIQYGKSTIGRKRYRHPDIKAEDLINGY